ncbi:MAG: SH3 domain-containing protein [Clostridia bacterium]|nr:SH3 domain-containing protein [Clostridia bacterium]
MTLDPKKCGACYYCKYRADIGTQTAGGEQIYLRKCTNQNLENVGVCVDTCYYFEPNPTVTPAKESNKNMWMIIAGIVAVVAIIAIVLVAVLLGRGDTDGGKNYDGNDVAAGLEDALDDLDGILGSGNNEQDKNVAGKVESTEEQTQQNTPAVPNGSVLIPFTYPENSNYIFVVITSKDPLNVRDIPGDYTDSKVIDTVPRFAVVTATEFMGEWTRIKYGKIEGYCSTYYIRCINELAPVVLSNDGKPIELLKNAKEDSVVQKTVAHGTEVLMIAQTKTGEYTKVYIDGSTYWVRSSQVY